MSSAEISIMIITFILQIDLIKQTVVNKVKKKHIKYKEQRVFYAPRKDFIRCPKVLPWAVWGVFISLFLGFFNRDVTIVPLIDS